MRKRAFAVNTPATVRGRTMAKWRRVTYTALIGLPALLFGPGCGGEPPKPPPGAPKTDPSELEAPTIELGEEADTTTPPADGPAAGDASAPSSTDQ